MTRHEFSSEISGNGFVWLKSDGEPALMLGRYDDAIVNVSSLRVALDELYLTLVDRRQPEPEEDE